MSCECDECGEHILDCNCDDLKGKNSVILEKDRYSSIAIACDYVNERNALRHMHLTIEQLTKLQRFLQAEILNLQEHFKRLTKGKNMDKQIKKVQKDIKKGEKDTKQLLKMDKKFDKKLEKCKIIKKKK